jgi:hypothetical protein
MLSEARNGRNGAGNIAKPKVSATGILKKIADAAGAVYRLVGGRLAAPAAVVRLQLAGWFIGVSSAGGRLLLLPVFP